MCKNLGMDTKEIKETRARLRDFFQDNYGAREALAKESGVGVDTIDKLRHGESIVTGSYVSIYYALNKLAPLPGVEIPDYDWEKTLKGFIADIKGLLGVLESGGGEKIKKDRLASFISDYSDIANTIHGIQEHRNTVR